MKKMTAMVLLFCFHALLIFFEVHKQSIFLTLSYDIQKLQSQKAILYKKQHFLQYTLQQNQQAHIIASNVKEKFEMEPIQLQKIQKTPQLPNITG
jgi:hypothetical protein